MPPKIYVHVGLPGTATTLCQRKIFPSLEGIAFLGKFDTCALEGHYEANFHSAEIAELMEWAMGHNRRTLQKMDICHLRSKLLASIPGDRPVLLSLEGLSDGLSIPYEKKCDRLKEAFPSASILLTLRHPQSLLLSFSRKDRAVRKEDLEPTQQKRLTQWLREQRCKQTDPRVNAMGKYSRLLFLDFGRRYQTYCQAFGSRVTVLAWEQLVLDPVEYVQEICKWIGSDPPPVDAVVELTQQRERCTFRAGNLKLPWFWRYRIRRQFRREMELFPEHLRRYLGRFHYGQDPESDLRDLQRT